MPNAISGAPIQVAGVPLNTSFGDQPLGRLGERSVQQLPAEAPRSTSASIAANLSAFARGVERLGTRLLNALTPASVRADSKVRSGLEATSGQVGELLGSLTQSRSHRVDGNAALRLLSALPETAQPITSRGPAFTQVLNERVELHLKNLTTEQLREVRDGVALALRNSPNGEPGPLSKNPAHATSLETIRGAVARELASGRLEIQGSGEATGGLKASFESNLANLARSSSALERLPDGTSTGVTHSLYADLDRANYSVGGQPLFTGSPGNQADRLSAVDRLRDFFGGNDALMLRVSEIANQQVLAGVELGCAQPDSPLRLPGSGTSGTMPPRSARDTSTAYELARDTAGDVTLRITYESRNSTTFQGVDGQTRALDPDKSLFRASVGVTFAPDGQVRVSDPLHYAYTLAQVD